MGKFRWLCLALAGCLVLGSVVWAAPDKGRPDGPKKPKHESQKGARPHGITPEQMLEKYTKELGLNADQQAEVGKILDAYVEGMADVRAKFKALYDEMAKAKQDKDEDALKALAEEKKELIQQMKVLRDEKDSDIIDVLSDEQKEKYEKMSAQHRGSHGKKGEGKHGEKGEHKGKHGAKK